MCWRHVSPSQHESGLPTGADGTHVMPAVPQGTGEIAAFARGATVRMIGTAHAVAAATFTN